MVYAVARVWNPVARSLSRRQEMVALVEKQARRLIVTDA